VGVANPTSHLPTTAVVYPARCITSPMADMLYGMPMDGISGFCSCCCTWTGRRPDMKEVREGVHIMNA